MSSADGRSSGVHVGRLGYVVLGTNDLEAMVEHYTTNLSLTVTERDGRAAYLAAGSDRHCLAIETGDSGLLRTGLEVATSLDEAEAHLQSRGIACERRSDPEPGVPEALVSIAPDGIPLHFHARRDGNALERGADDLSPRKLGHVATFVPDLEAASRYYLDGLGLRWGDSVALGDTVFFMFMGCGPDHHTLNVMENPDEHGLHHIAFEARDIEHIRDVCDRLARARVGLEWGLGRHGPGHNVYSYHRDPDGNVVEVFTDLDVMSDEEAGCYDPRPWHEDTPQRPKVWPFSPDVANTWGPGPSDPDFLKAPAWIGEAIAAAQA